MIAVPLLPGKNGQVHPPHHLRQDAEGVRCGMFAPAAVLRTV